MIDLEYSDTFPKSLGISLLNSSYIFFLGMCPIRKAHYTRIYSCSIESNALQLLVSSSDLSKSPCIFFLSLLLIILYFIRVNPTSLPLSCISVTSTSQESILEILYFNRVATCSTRFNLVLYRSWNKHLFSCNTMCILHLQINVLTLLKQVSSIALHINPVSHFQQNSI